MTTHTHSGNHTAKHVKLTWKRGKLNLRRYLYKPTTHVYRFPKMGVPQNGWLIMEKSNKVDGAPPF